MSKKTQVAKVENTAPVVYDYGDHAGKGTSDLSRAEKGLPFIKLLQPLNPEVVGPRGKVAGAEAGMFYNTGTEQLSSKLTLVPACRIHVIQEWIPREQKGGLKNQTVMKTGDDFPDFYKEAMARQEADGRKFGDFWTGEPEKSNQLKECFQLFCVVMEDGIPIGWAVVPFTSSSIKIYKHQFSRRVGSLRGDPPFYSHCIELTTEQLSNDKHTWFSLVITFPVENNVLKSQINPESAGFQAGAELYELVKSGAVKADLAQAPQGGGGSDGETSAF